MNELSVTRGVLIVAMLELATDITRFLPFLLFPAGKKVPRYVEYLGRTLPYATIGLLVVYCLKDIRPLELPYGIPQLLAAAVTAVLHWKTGNSLLSIGAGTLLYMVLVQAVFV